MELSCMFRSNVQPYYGLLAIIFFFIKDVSDLFGADLPVEGGKMGEFSWRDGPFLQALKNGHWILLDEVYTKILNKICKANPLLNVLKNIRINMSLKNKNYYFYIHMSCFKTFYSF